MKNKKTKIINIILFVIVFLLTLRIIIKVNDINLFIKNIKNINLFYFFLSFFSMALYLFLDGLIVGIILKPLGIQTEISKLTKYSCINFFFSGITPSSTGGEPMKLYSMKKDGIALSKGALSILIGLTCFLIVNYFIGLLGLIINFKTISKMGFMKFIVLLGFILSFLYIIILLIVIFNKKFALKMLNIITKILNKFNFKNKEELIKKIEKQINDYHKCSIYIKQNKKVLLKVIIVTLIELILYHLIPYIICLSFGIKVNPVYMITMSAVLYVSVSFLPFPGSMGVNEGSFMILYRHFVRKSLLPSIMIITRMINYYIFIIITSIVVLIIILKNKK